MGQELQGHDPLLVQGGPHHDVHGKVGLVGGVIPFGHRVGGFHFPGLVEGSLEGDLHFQGAGLGEPAQVFPVHVVQPVVDVHIPVQVDISVFRAVVFFVEGHESFLGQLGNGGRQAAGFEPVRGIREQGLHHLMFLDGVRGGIDPLHFVVDHAVVHQGLVLSLAQFVMPAFLAQGKGIFPGQGIEHRIQVHVRQVPEVLGIPAGHRIHGFVRVGHGVQEGVQGAFHQFHEGFLQPVFPAAAEDGMFGDVGHPGIILAGGPEPDGEHFVVVLAGQVEQPGAADLMDHFIGRGFDIRQRGDFLYGKTMEFCPNRKFHAESSPLMNDAFFMQTKLAKIAFQKGMTYDL